jgi:predicted transglutaminase-like cysteine proteinase
VLDWVGERYGAAARERVSALRALMVEAASATESDKLGRVNDFFNSVPYGSDASLWSQDDYWATPIEVLGIDGADCEDYAIAKYFTLRGLGVPAERLRITYVKALTLNQAHMVLAYYEQPDAEPFILDNLSDRIETAGRRDDLIPVYSFNGDGLWLAVSRAQGEKIGRASRIKRWTRLRQKLDTELSR